MSNPYFSIAVLLSASAAWAQDTTFAGEWRLNSARSVVNGSPEAGVRFLHVEQSRVSLSVSGTDSPGGAAITTVYPLDGTSGRLNRGTTHLSIKTKWEGDALLVSTLFSGPQNYSVDERWTPSKDGHTLTITKAVTKAGVETESTLVYENPALIPVPAPGPAVVTEMTVPSGPLSVPKPAPVSVREYILNPGTRILMQLTNAVDTKHSMAGDRVYLETAVPVFANRRLVIPAHSYVTGTVIESARAGRVKGKSSLNIRFESLTLPNGTTRNFTSRAGNVDGRGDLDRTEGRIEGEGNKSGDAGKVAKTTAAGTGIGTLAGAAAGNLGMGAGIGAAAGALGGLAGVLGSRGPDVVLRPGTTMEFILDRELRFLESELLERVH